MKKLFPAAVLLIAIAIAVVLVLWLFKSPSLSDKENGASSQLNETAPSFSSQGGSSADEETNNASNLPREERLLDKYIALVESGRYSLTLTRQRLFGGNSVPVVTVTRYCGGYISVKQAEAHDISTEIFINAEGVYHLNVAENTAILFPPGSFETDFIPLEGLVFIDKGESAAGNFTYDYEKYRLPNGSLLDYLFSGGELQKMKLYTGDEEYELVGVNISPDVSDARASLPEGMTINDCR